MLDLRNPAWSLGLILLALFVAFILQRAIVTLNRRALRRNPSPLLEVWVRYGQESTRIILPLMAVLIAIPWLRLQLTVLPALTHTLALALIAAIGWRAIKMVHAFEAYIRLRHPLRGDNLISRQVGTQVQVLRHIVILVIVVVTIAVMLMTFPNIRHVGESLFASAGLAAIVGGLAARSTLSNMLAGIQIALTQPIRLEDAVIVEGEWGWIEEITTTYVVVRIWDLRRLVVPLSYFIEKPFQNWTRQAADLLGTAFIYVDYTVPVDAVREQLQRILTESGIWDGKTWGLQVTNLSERTVELRALMSAPNSSLAFDLRCYVREKLVAFLQQQYPHSLPRTRAEIAQVTESRDQSADVSTAA